MINTVYLLLGSNMGNKIRLLQEASALIDSLAGKIVHYSSFYESEPWGFECDEWFINQAVCIHTFLPPEKLLQTTKAIERTMGRQRSQLSLLTTHYSSRPIDIDILFYNEMLVNTPELTIPHPLLQERRFVLLPLAEIAAGLVHPVFQKTIAVLLEECGDKGAVRRQFT